MDERIASSVIGAIYEAAEGEDRWRVLHDELKRSVRFGYCDFVTGTRLPDQPILACEEDPPRMPNDLVRFRHGVFDVEERTAFDDREGMLDHYVRDFSQCDPLAVELDSNLSTFVELPDTERAAAGDASRTGSGGTNGTCGWQASAYYNEFLVPYGVLHPARFITRVTPTRFLVANFDWHVPYEEVTREERRLVNLAMSHAARVLDLEAHNGPVLGGVDTLLGTLDMVDEAAFVVDAGLGVHTLNRAARDLMAVDPTLSVRRGALTFRSAEAEEAVRARVAGREIGFDRSLFLLDSVLGRRTLRAHMSPLYEFGARQNGASLLFLLVLDARNASRVGRLVTRAVLTAREQHAMLALAAFGSERTAAEALGVSLNTFRSHRRSSYGKLGIGSRTELLQLLDL